MGKRTVSCDLYRFYNKDERLLYVGISLSAATRASQHRTQKPWWPDVARMDVEHLATREAALGAERRAIWAEHPMHNIAHNHTGSDRMQPIEVRWAVDRVYAFGLSDGQCPVGMVDRIWYPDEAHPAQSFEIALYSWFNQHFAAGVREIEQRHVVDSLEAAYVMDGRTQVFDMDPLADFQTAWKRLHDAA